MRNVTDMERDAREYERQDSESTPLTDTMEGAEQYRLYRLCPCGECGGTGKQPTVQSATERCKTCRGEGKNLELVATAGSKEAVGTALVTLTEEGEFDECPFGLMHRPEGEKGRWLLKPWLPSARNVSDAGRTLARSKNPVTPS